MEINIAKSAGFCTGVKRALKIAKHYAQKVDRIYMLGDIVHNETVVKEIKKLGIKKTARLTSGKNKTILIRAHGAPKKTYQKAKKLGYKIIDATCPMVKEIHKIARSHEKKGYKIIVIGDKKHDEVQGIVGQLNKQAIVITPNSTINKKRINNIKKAAVVTQSTQNIEKVTKVVDKLKNHIPKLKFINTICKPTQQKQDEIKKMPYKNDIMLIVGSRTSANTKRLYQISKVINKDTYWIRNVKDIKPGWFKNVKSVGITAGASTPESSIKSVINKLKEFNQ
ncbi:MAG: 4-hydroxy-3-methylbut-2-enyl diphosphate reductase [Candidatus Omnitrophota bacterium]